MPPSPPFRSDCEQVLLWKIAELIAAGGGGGGGGGVTSFNARVGVVTLTSADVTNALGYTPAPAGSGVTSFNGRTGAVSLLSADVTTALGFTPGNVASPLSQFAATTSAQLAGVVSDETGSGALVFATSPTLVTPNLGTPSAVVLTNATGLPVSGIAGLGAGVATFLGTPSSANLAAAVTDETGSGALVFATSPTLVTPNLGTPSAVVLTNATGLPLAAVTGLGANVATFLATPSSANLAAAVTDETGTGALMFATSPSITTGFTLTRNSLGPTTSEGMYVINTTAAAAGVQQYSPSLRFMGQGWKTNAVAASQNVEFRMFVVPVQGSASPSGSLTIQSSINGSTFSDAIEFLGGSSTRGVTLANGGTGASFVAQNAGFFTISGRSKLGSSANGLFEATNNAGTDFLRLNFGGTTSSFPGLQRVATSIGVLGADGATPVVFSVYNSLTSATNYERLDIRYTTNVCHIDSSQGSGGGTARELRVEFNNGQNISISSQRTILESIADVNSATQNFALFTDLFQANDTAGAYSLGFFGAPVAAQQASGANLTNNVTVGGVNDTIADFAGVLYATDAATIRDDIYQLARKLKQVNDALRLYGLLT